MQKSFLQQAEFFHGLHVRAAERALSSGDLRSFWMHSRAAEAIFLSMRETEKPQVELPPLFPLEKLPFSQRPTVAGE